MHNLPFIDAHMHLWDLKRLHYPWLTPPFDPDGPNGDVTRIAESYGLADYARESAGWNVCGAVHVEAGASPEHAIDETHWLQAMGRHEGRPTVIVAAAALNDPQLEAALAAHTACDIVRGIRHIVNWHPDPARSYRPRDVTRDADWQRGYALLKKYGLSFDLQAYPVQFPVLAQLIARHDETAVVINHAGMGIDLDAAGTEQWRRGMRALAQLPCVSVKLSGFGFVWQPFAADCVRQRIHEILDLFSAERVMLASDFPTDRLFADFNTTLGTLRDAIADLSRSEQLAIFAGNANRIYRMGLDLKNNQQAGAST
jgi:predicted TIM-barrel fold metal-dependent hydrolase